MPSTIETLNKLLGEIRADVYKQESIEIRDYVLHNVEYLFKQATNTALKSGERTIPQHTQYKICVRCEKKRAFFGTPFCFECGEILHEEEKRKLRAGA